ncbi:MAG: HPr(Ser) kinase/phosphatase [Oscillospiraceae bacterium]|nr:HPr(Ser) kinase/phosphatase [Oscillospiraceae bacterium]
MSTKFTVKLSAIIKHHHLTPVYLPKDADEILITTPEISRPGLELTGFLNYFNGEKIQVIGNTERAYLTGRKAEMEAMLDPLFALHPAVMVVAHGNEPFPAIVEAAKKHGWSLLRTDEVTSSFMSALISNLNVELAPRITRHGVLVEVYGVGVLLMGESGVGKSETAVELVKRGHRLIADDAVEIRRVSPKTLVGSSPKNIRHFMELRGIGIINIRRLFGVGSVKLTESIDMIANLEQWDSSKVYDRMGIDTTYTEILENKVPMLTIPVKPGRNLAVIIEVAAMNQRQKNMGYNAAHDLLSRLGMTEDLPEPPIPQSPDMLD